MTTTREAPAFTWDRGHTLALIVLCLAQVLDSVDATVVNVALPAIRHDLGFDPADLSWVVNAYMVPFGGFLLLGGRLGDLLGHRRILFAGIALFTVASSVAGFAQNAGTLIGGRALQGVGAALIAPMTLALIALIFPEGKPRNRALAAWGASTGVSTTVGLFAGGLLADGPGWRWIFFVNLPVGLLLLVALRRLPVPETARTPGVRRDFDVVGAITSTAGVGLLAYAILQTESGSWGSARTPILLAVSLALIAYFIVHETRIAREPLIAFSLFRNRSVSGANAIQAVRGGAMFAVFYMLTLYLQEVLGHTALETGLAYVPMTLALIGAAALAPVLLRRVGLRPVVAAGALVSAGGLLLFTRISPTGTFIGDVLLPLLVTGVSFGIVIVPLTTAALDGVSPEYSGVASALLNVSAQLGGALGLAILSAVAVNRTGDRLRTGAPAEAALTEGFSLAFGVSAAMMVVIAGLALVMFRPAKPSPEEAKA
ncbi:MFS transporter [Rhizohabitans arisaemae]|uniref:MFS transporter n=1 Tax=Rhizohabitans arisaemae TaxID=2720610 RepID=UPI0024B12C4D|nr:MFS transporter [Rhizohabitans arisaemae]